MKALFQVLIGMILATGAVFYASLVITSGLNEGTYLFGGLLAVLALIAIGLLGWPNEGEQ
ncbi:hypothetical protein Pan110_46570 [Gimesia panareensis]|nr:hypothetical protein Pan110_46570 [Gimesia panareensis]